MLAALVSSSGDRKSFKKTLFLFPQVSIVAVQVLGEERKLNGEVEEKPSYTSTYEDLSFEMYVHEDVADTIRSLDLKKQQAVKGRRLSFHFSFFQSYVGSAFYFLNRVLHFFLSLFSLDFLS